MGGGWFKNGTLSNYVPRFFRVIVVFPRGTRARTSQKGTRRLEWRSEDGDRTVEEKEEEEEEEEGGE